jgi:hypothetical protein
MASVAVKLFLFFLFPYPPLVVFFLPFSLVGKGGGEGGSSTLGLVLVCQVAAAGRMDGWMRVLPCWVRLGW